MHAIGKTEVGDFGTLQDMLQTGQVSRQLKKEADCVCGILFEGDTQGLWAESHGVENRNCMWFCAKTPLKSMLLVAGALGRRFSPIPEKEVTVIITAAKDPAKWRLSNVLKIDFDTQNSQLLSVAFKEFEGDTAEDSESLVATEATQEEIQLFKRKADEFLERRLARASLTVLVSAGDHSPEVHACEEESPQLTPCTYTDRFSHNLYIVARNVNLKILPNTGNPHPVQKQGLEWFTRYLFPDLAHRRTPEASNPSVNRRRKASDQPEESQPPARRRKLLSEIHGLGAVPG